MTAQSHRVINQRMCNISICLADGKRNMVRLIGVLRVTWKGEKGPINISLSDTLVPRGIRNSLLSVPFLVKKTLGRFFYRARLSF